ncbi:MAG: hypothetical protein MR923_10225 [Prevotella sp.]|nr:hypothetical protein [Prevotella sp.]
MKKFGYIYKYNPSEGMGILMFGVWKVKGYWGTTIKNTPIMFSDKDLLSDVKTGQLVYFDLEGNIVSNIERASLSNFKLEYINSLITCKSNESEYSFYSDNTFISFERLDNIIISNEDDLNQTEKNSEDDEEFDFGDLDLDEFDAADSSTTAGNDLSEIIKGTDNLTESIKELYDCFGKYKHEGGKESTSLNVFDLSLWVDAEDLSDEYYGKKVDELLSLYKIFVLKMHYNKNGNVIPVKLENDCISPTWSLLLSKFNESDLKEIIYKAPKLQPALPADFCKNNADILTEKQGMPNVEICKVYCLYKISNAEYISNYKDLKHKFYVYRNCNATHLEGEGTPMCKMGKTRIKYLEKRLEEQYEKVIKLNVIAQFSKLCKDANVIEDFNHSTPDNFELVAVFIEYYSKLKSNFLEYEMCDKVLESYEKLTESYKDALKQSLLNFFNESAISVTQSEKLTPFWLSYSVKACGSWILASTKQRIKELVNDRFSKLDDLEELSDAYKADYITSLQYYNKYKELTCTFNAYQFLKELFDYKTADSPEEIQWYVVSSIIKQLGYKSLYQNDYNYIKIEYTDSIYDISSLLKWLTSYGNLKDTVIKKAEDKICSVLSKEERWTLFEEKIIQSPGAENIRERLDNVYKNRLLYKIFAKEEIGLFKHSCFQDVMLSDLETASDPDLKLFIADNLDSSHQTLMEQKASGFMKLYLWQKQPSDNYDWNLIKSHYHELSNEAQIKILRYIFGKMSSGDFSLSFDDLYSEFVETTTPACPAICGILCMLKAKRNDLDLSITPSIIESVIGEEEIRRIDFLKDSKALFYPCHGYLAISGNKHDIEYQSFNGILTKENKKDELYYVIKFYDTPVDLFGRTIEWLDSEDVEIAKQVLLRNSSVDVINGKYYIHGIHEFFVKQFVIAYDIDDKCGLVSDKERMIEMGWLPRNNAYQPLYTNYIRKYEDSDNYICRGGCFGGSDSMNNDIPFFWCNKKMCVRRAHFLLPPSKWEDYRFADLLFIILGQTPDVRESVWRVNGEVSQFICDYEQVVKSNERNICSKSLDESEEVGTWDDNSSIYRDIYDGEDDDEYEDGDFDNYSYDQEKPTYDRYNGSYAQDEMGYSDDDIDTIFDGDPDAYWNID